MGYIEGLECYSLTKNIVLVVSLTLKHYQMPFLSLDDREEAHISVRNFDLLFPHCTLCKIQKSRK